MKSMALLFMTLARLWKDNLATKKRSRKAKIIASIQTLMILMMTINHSW